MKSKRKKTRLLKQFAPKPESKRSGKPPVTLVRNDRWCCSWLRNSGRMLGVGLLYTAIIAFILFLLSLSFGCSTTPKEPVAMEEETIVRYGKGSVERSRGIIARTQNGNFLVSSGYVTWAENLKIDLDAALAKLEQERISKLAK